MKPFFIWLLLLFSISNLSFASGHNLIEKSLSAPCATCHGPDGRSLNPAWPHLAGQQTDYLQKQLHDLKSGHTRHVDPAMAPFINQLSDEDIASLAHFYATKPSPPGSHRLRTKNELGETLYREGNRSKQVIACITCHGAHAEGNGVPGFPSLKGQQIQYIIHQLEAFKSGERDNDLSRTMTHIAKQLDAEEIYALAYYLASL